MSKFSVAVIGGGAAGMIAAISAKRSGKSVIICDRMPRLGKKVLTSGNGRCNLLNERLDDSFYNEKSRHLVKSVFSKFGKSDILNFFKEIGLEIYSEDGRLFPITNQASSVVKVLEMELARLAVPIELNFEAYRISRSGDKFITGSKTIKAIESDKLIMTGGGKSYPALGSDGSCYLLAKNLGHKIVEPVPAAVPLVVKDILCHPLQGQKIFAKVSSIVEGKEISQSYGDLLFTKYGLSGTAILDSSEEVSIALNRFNKKDVSISVDMVPFMKEEDLEKEITKRMQHKIPAEDLMAGILPNKFGPALKNQLSDPGLGAKDIVKMLKNRSFKVIGTRGWNEADFTSGGVDVDEVKESTMESKLTKGLYLAGEILDVCGKSGGYNLAWAWASGYVAGLTE